MNDWMKEYYEKIKSGEELNEKQLRELSLEGGLSYSIDSGRWQEQMVTVLNFDDEVYLLYWQKGLTEEQENLFEEQPIKVSVNKKEEIIKYNVFEYFNNDGKNLFTIRKPIKEV